MRSSGVVRAPSGWSDQEPWLLPRPLRPRRRRPPPPPRRHRPLPRGPEVRKWRRRGAVLLAPILLGVLGPRRAAPRLHRPCAAGHPPRGHERRRRQPGLRCRERMTRFKVSPVAISAAGKHLQGGPGRRRLPSRRRRDPGPGAGCGTYRIRPGRLRHGQGTCCRSRTSSRWRPWIRWKLEASRCAAFARLVNRPAYPGAVSGRPGHAEGDVAGPASGTHRRPTGARAPAHPEPLLGRDSALRRRRSAATRSRHLAPGPRGRT